ncbi:cation-transporting ATPase [Coniophora puteana RWD-64-598 SS2]|uniref:Cation-transporting ATPase n=1 Tax=Coniophora puteana (strain RWD-64-598) TaxID=741705 RepID=A0A5M3MA23_CONPW|nr:cation-transporting ATPase [Coniophora puteana RWD-64-598 SS2]EIW76098.1 cation-transporting ATPase [Coniophora puteana RWD-64-598 SS2]
MRLLQPAFVALATFCSAVLAQQAEKYEYQSDVARLRRIVVDSLYSNRDVFLRELISNANDAIEKLRLTALTEKTVWDGAAPLNITIKTEKDEDGKGGRIIITDTGIGMNPEELTKNLGTLARSGTSEFLAKAESEDATGSGNLIGAFGLGFYSSFLVADRVQVASRPPVSSKDSNPSQYVFSSSSDDATFEIYPDPRGNTLDFGTEVTLFLKDDAASYLDASGLTKLVNTHSSFSSAFPIYLWTEKEEQILDEDAEETTKEAVDDEEAAIEEVDESPEPPKMKTVTVGNWEHLNSQPPLWMRDPKEVSEEEYNLLYKATFKDLQEPLAHHHFTGDTGSGVSFRALIYVPSKLDETYFNDPLASAKDIRLLVKHVFITSDFGEHALPKWASWVKVIIDADDLPLNVSRETLQSGTFLKQVRQIVLKRIIQLFSRIAEEDEEKFAEIQKVYGTVFKLGASEDAKNKEKLAGLTRFTTNQRKDVSFDQYLENKKEGQKQIFYLADMGKAVEDLAQSVFVEKLHARGYEVLLMNEPLDEIVAQTLRTWKGVTFQDVAKSGLKFGDEDNEEDKQSLKQLKTEFTPLVEWLKQEVGDAVRDVVVSDRLVTSPCAVVADSMGFTANVQKLMSATNRAAGAQNDFMTEFMKKQKVLEINPRAPLIQGMLRRVDQLSEDKDEDAEAELKEVASILLDGALVRSGFEVPNSNLFLTRVDRVLRRSLGVSETAAADSTVKPAPPVDPKLPDVVTGGDEKMFFQVPDDIEFEMEEIDEDGNVIAHDEL